MKEKIFKIILISILIMSLTMIDFVVVGQGIVIALAEGSEMLDSATNIKNVEFNAYFKDGDASTDNKQSIISDGDNLFFMIAVNEVGALENGKIKIENSNFRLKEVQSEYIKNINVDANEIEFNQIIAGNVVEISVPIAFEKIDEISKEYISQDTKIVFTGDYKNNKNASKKVISERNVRVTWRENTEITINQDVDKYIYLENDVTLIQQKVNSQVLNNTLVHSKVLEASVQEIEGVLPERVDVLINGKQAEQEKYSYDKQNKIVTVQNMDNNIENDEYKIIYYYPKRLKAENLSLSLNSKVKALLYTDEVVEKDDVKEIQIKQMDNRVSVNVDTTKSIYKGYLYVNSNKDTQYQENINTEISTLEGIANIEIKQMQDYFVNQSGIKSSVNGSTFIKNIKFTKSNLESILGNDFSISIFVDNDKVLSEINKESEWDDKGDLFIPLEEQELGKVRILCSQPTNIGTLHIEMERYIKGETGYNKEQLKSFNNLTNTKIVSVGEKQIPVNSTVLLEDTCTEARIEISNSNLSVLNINENVQILAVLKSDSEKYDLYKNPYVEIKLPDEIQDINVHAVNVLNSDGLSVAKAGYASDIKTIQIQLQGEQSDFRTKLEEGIQIVINADVILRKNVPDKEATITMLYKNENAGNQQYETNTNINLSSKYGAILYNNISGYSDENEVIESVESEELKAQLDVNSKEKHASVNQTFINNYDTPIDQITIVGSLVEGDSNFEAGLVQKIVTDNEGAKVYYSDKKEIELQDESWRENIENLQDVKSYKIVLDKELQPSESMNMNYQLDIPAQLEEGSETYQSTNVTYSMNGQALNASSSIQLYTEGIKSTAVAKEENGIKTEISAISANKELTDGEEIFEGQPVRYTVKITNDTGKDLNNFEFIAEHTNVVYYVEKEKEAEVTDNPDNPEIMIFTQKDEEAKNITKKLSKLKNGETATFVYQFSPKKKDGIDINGNVRVKADNLEEVSIPTITNKIKDAKVAVEVLNLLDETYQLREEDTIPFRFNVTNNTKDEQKDIILDIKTSDELTCSDSATLLENALSSLFEDGLNVQVLKYEKNTIILKIPVLKPEQTLNFNLMFECGEISEKEVMDDANIYYTAQLEDTTYFSNTIYRGIQRISARVTAKQESNVKEDILEIGDKIVYTAEIENVDSVLNAEKMKIDHIVTEGNAKIEKAYLRKSDGTVVDAKIEKTNEAVVEYDLKAGEKVQYIAEVLLWNNPDEDINYSDTVSSYIKLSWEKRGTLDLNVIEHEIQTELPDDPDDSEDPDNPENPDNPNKPNNSNKPKDDDDTYSISGSAWIDINRDGVKDEEEELIDNLDVTLLSSTGELLENIKTGREGKYEFSDLENGKYIVMFAYDSSQYSVTQYQKEGVNSNINSDAIQKEKDGKVVAMTDTLTISGRDIKNIDVGLMKNVKFDFSLDKSINKVIVKNVEGTKEKDFDNTKLAKVEINAKYMNGSTVVVEYTINVKNEGEIQGYANEIIDYMPKDLKFSSEINKDWYIGADGNLHNISLSDTIIKPGETKTLTLTLTKQMTTQNTGRSVNIAEIAAATNELSIADVDSVPGNRKDNEDDISTAELIISTKTGAVVISISIVFVLVLMLAVAYVLYRKKKGGK